MDKAARAALLTAKGMDKTSENIADYVADLLRQGRAKEITDDLMEQADPQRLMHHYKSGNTGMDLPMDKASRMARAKQMGFDTREYHGTTTGGDMRYPSPNYGSGTRKNIGFVTSSNPYVASTYADPNFGSVFPMLNRDPNLAKLNAEGRAWSDIPEETEVTLPSGGKTDVGRYASGPADMGGVHDTNQIARGAHIEGHGGVRVANILDRSIHLPDDQNDPSLRQEFQKKSSVPSDVTFRQDTRGMRSQFARFDPRLDHLAHLSASTGGAMDFARHVEAVNRAGGQIAPSKYLPNVPRAVHAGGGKVAYHATQEPFENYDWGRLGQTTKDNTSGTSVDDWASSLASLGPWSHEKPLSKQLGMKTDLPVMLTGKEKKFKSLDHLSQEISRHGGPAALREKLVSQGYGYVSVDDEEFGGKSYVGLSPDHFNITKAGGGALGDDDGITAYHGSPHSFDQFDIGKLGTGEGAQSFGHGLYFAGNEKVAKSYKNGISLNKNLFDVVDRKTRELIDPNTNGYEKVKDFFNNFAYDLRSGDTERFKQDMDRDKKRVIDHIKDFRDYSKTSNDPDFFMSEAQRFEDGLHHFDAAKSLIDKVRAEPKGHMYKVKLNVKPEELLDWDKPLSEQPEVARKLGYASHEDINQRQNTLQSKMRPIDMDKFYEPETHALTPEEEQAHTDAGPPLEHWGNMTGKDLHDRLQAYTGSKKGAADAMQAAGLKGIKYLDAGSRGTSNATGSHNYVMFHHDPVQIVDKYEYGGTVGKEEGGDVEQMEQPANGMHMLRMRRAGINTKEDFWNRWRDRMKATALPNTNISAIGSKDGHFQQIDKLINFHRQDADANGIRSVLQNYGRIGPDRKKIHTLEDGSMAAAQPKAILQGAGIEPTIDNASQIYHSLPDDESGRVGKAGGGEMDGVESNNQNGGLNVGTQNETGTAPFNPAPRAQAGKLRDAGRVRGGSGVLQAPDEAPLEGLLTPVTIPMTGQVIHAAPDPRVRQVARDYMASTGLPYNPPKKYAKADPTRALRISDAYEAMKDNSSDPLTKASYAAMIKETMAQYHAAKAAGFKAEFWDPQTQEDPYHASPRLATEDIKNNNHMFVFPTDSGYGSDGPITAEQIKTNPLLQPSGETWNGIPVTVNDIFRAVHDYFGHAKEGVGFRADGEENAWRSHAAMYSPLARMAMTSETRGQNSWLNFNPVSGERNRKARTKNSTFADQKVGILPHWVHHEGAEDFMGPEEVNAMAAIRKVHGRATGGSVDAALALTRRFTKDGKAAIVALKSKGK